MSNKKNWWLLSLALVVIVLASVNKMWIKEESRVEVEVKKVFVENDKKEEVFCINNFCLKKIEGKWWLENGEEEAIEAENELVEIYFNKLMEMEYGEVVSKNETNFFEFGIGKEEEVLILEMWGKKVELGSIASDYEGSYFRDYQGDRIYKSKIIFDKEIMTDKNYWIKKSEEE